MDFGRFADSGSDANWYVGYNNTWIVRLPPAPRGEFVRAFIGAKLGRAKTKPSARKPWLREAIDGKVYIAISQRPAFSSAQSFFLVDSQDIPLEADPAAYVEGVGASEWFWTEVPTGLVSSAGPNYLAIWSPTKYFVRASSAPILAAADIPASASDGPRAWNNRSISGIPPRNAESALETPINNIGPALAIKLVPPNESEVAVSDAELLPAGKKTVVHFSVEGEDVSEAWVEASLDQLDWARVSRIRRSPPFIFSIPAERLPGAGSFLRGVARDVFGNVGRGPAAALPYASQP